MDSLISKLGMDYIGFGGIDSALGVEFDVESNVNTDNYAQNYHIAYIRGTMAKLNGAHPMQNG